MNHQFSRLEGCRRVQMVIVSGSDYGEKSGRALSSDRSLNKRAEQSNRHIKQRYYPMLGFKQFDSASRFCTAFDELRNYLKVRTKGREQVSAAGRQQIFSDKWTTLVAELAA